VLGVLAALALPVAIVATRYSDSFDLLHAGLAIPAALGCGLGALSLARRARRSGSLVHGAPVADRRARAARVLAVIGIALAASATISLVVYAVLTYLGERG
jgi:peptidoglycan/LPS O-acetylase OafA/YrhL